jgi:hypothetical protein
MRVRISQSPIVPPHFERAARAYARCNVSDPFSYGRMLCHLLRGIEDASAVLAASVARGAERGERGVA